MGNSVGSGHVSHRWTSCFHYHFDHSFIVLKNVQLRHLEKNVALCEQNPHHSNAQFVLLLIFLGLGLEWRVAPVSWMPLCLDWTVLLVERSTSITVS